MPAICAPARSERALRAVAEGDRDAVHHHPVERRLVALGAHVLAQHPPHRRIQRHALAAERRHARADPLFGFGNAGEFAHKDKTCSPRRRRLPRRMRKAWGRCRPLTTAAKVDQRRRKPGCQALRCRAANGYRPTPADCRDAMAAAPKRCAGSIARAGARYDDAHEPARPPRCVQRVPRLCHPPHRALARRSAASAPMTAWPRNSRSRCVYNGVSFAVMMATPHDLVDFALGFSLSEGLIRSAGRPARRAGQRLARRHRAGDDRRRRGAWRAPGPGWRTPAARAQRLWHLRHARPGARGAPARRRCRATSASATPAWSARWPACRHASR